MDVPGVMPPAAPEFLHFYRLGECTDGGEGKGKLEEVSHWPVNQVETTLLKDVWIHQ